MKFFNRQPSIRQLLETVLSKLEKLMSGVSDLNAAVAALTNAVATENTAIQAVIATLQAGGISDAQAETLAQTLQASISSIQTETANLNNVLPPAQGTPATKAGS